MTTTMHYQVFLSYSETNVAFVESLAQRLYGDGDVSFWFAPWHSIPGQPIQEQMEDAFKASAACAIFISGDPDPIAGWQNREMREAIRKQVEENPHYRVIPVFVPGETSVDSASLPPFLKHYFRPGLEISFHSPDEQPAFYRLLAAILGVPPIQIDGYLKARRAQRSLPAPTAGFERGHALVVGVADYAHITPLPESVRHDARDLQQLLTDQTRCGYPAANVRCLIDAGASGANIREALQFLAARTGPEDTVLVFFSGHGAHRLLDGGSRQYLLPHDVNPRDLEGTAISGEEMTAMLQEIPSSRLLVLFDSCHSGGAGDPKGALPEFRRGMDEDYYAGLAQGKGRVVMASCRPDELSWVVPSMRNSLFTHYLLAALRGEAKTVGDRYVRVFDVFRHVAHHVPSKAQQHPIFKAMALEADFPIAVISQ